MQAESKNTDVVVSGLSGSYRWQEETGSALQCALISIIGDHPTVSVLSSLQLIGVSHIFSMKMPGALA